MDIIEGGFQIDGDHGVPLLLGHAEHESVFSDAGVVDEHVDAAEVVFDLLHSLFRGGEIGCIRCVALAAHAQGGNLLLGLLAVLVDHEIGECDVGAFRCEFERDLFSNSTGCSCDHSHFSFK